MAILNVENLEVSYGLIKAIKGISFHVEEGEIVALIGANGAGKTTTMHAIARLISSEAGKIEFAGTDITKYPAHKIVQLGMSQVPEGRRIFQELKVKENLTLGAFTRKDKTETWRAPARRCIPFFPFSRRGKTKSRVRFRAENNRCWPWRGR